MKIGIVGDTHYGAGFNLGKTDPGTQLNSRLIDFSKTFNNIIDGFIKRNVSTVVLTGDIFETKHPTPSQLSIFSKCIQRAVDNGMSVIMAVGNHDQQRAISTTTIDIYNSLSLDKIVAYPNMGVHKINDGKKIINLLIMPYRDRRMVHGAQNNADAINILRKDVLNLTSKLVGPKIAVGHFMIDKAVTGETSEVFSLSELVLPLDMFDGFDAVLMGHVHKHDVISKNPLIIYTGSMEKITFGEKNHDKVSIVLDTDDFKKSEIIKTNVRDLFEMNFDYTQDDKLYASEINDKIVSDIGDFDSANKLDGSIVKICIKVKENDLYFVNQDRIREFVLSKNVNYLVPIQITTMSSRKLRSKEITETVDSKIAMAAFIKSLNETDVFKKKLLKFANAIIEEVEGK